MLGTRTKCRHKLLRPAADYLKPGGAGRSSLPAPCAPRSGAAAAAARPPPPLLRVSSGGGSSW